MNPHRQIEASTLELSESNTDATLHCAVPQLGLYVHVPFCATSCNFCAFVQGKPDRIRIRRYLDAICSEWNHRFQTSQPQFSTVFWGGGTPGLLLPKDLERLAQATVLRADRTALREWTVEMAPATVTPSKLRMLRELGVTRISMGVQTFDDATLRIMDRFHSVAQIHRAWDWICEAGFASRNIDMIIAYPGQKPEALVDDLEKAIHLAPDHISTYCLTFEEDTPLYAKLMQGIYKIDLEAEAELYRLTWQFLESHGYAQYEISNFARPGHASIHNCNTWQMQEWVGLGPSAASQHKGQRWSNHPDFETWESGCLNARLNTVDTQDLSPSLLLCDSLIFGLRMNTGVNLEGLCARFAPLTTERWSSLFKRLVQEGLAEQHGSSLRLTLSGRLLADAIAVEILERA